MLPGEEKKLHRLAMRSFPPVEALGASIPKQAIVAVVGDEIVGATFLKIFKGKGGRKTGYLDLAFVVKSHRGMGVGNMLYPAAVQKLKFLGCDVVSAMVKDDNVSSWGLLDKQGFRKLSYLDFFKAFGFAYGLKLWLRTFFCVTCGMNFWADCPAKDSSSLREIASFVGINLLLLMGLQGLRMVQGHEWQWNELFAGCFLLGFVLLAGWVGKHCSQSTWHFHMPRGGFLISAALMTFGQFFPMLGRWYPDRFERTKAQRNALGLAASVEWLAFILLYLLASLAFSGIPFWSMVARYSTTFLQFRILAIYPFEYFGGRRVFSWQPAAYLLLAGLSLVAMLL